MAVKTCCIQNCNSSSNREEDLGVTYHKFPKDINIRNIWVTITHHEYKSDAIEYVCSRHFCKSDFQTYKDSKYILKSDAVPSIFPWTMADIDYCEGQTDQSKMEKDPSEKVIKEKETENLNNSKESEIENLDAIKKFIEDQEKEISESKPSNPALESECSTMEDIKQDIDNAEPPELIKNIKDIVITTEDIKEEVEKNKPLIENVFQEETMAVASSVMDMILSESDAKIVENENMKLEAKSKLNCEKGTNSVALSVGSQVEAKDFGEFWHPAKIAEVDFEEMEVLVHYEDDTKKHDEWISVSSPRLRPRGSNPTPTPSSPIVDNTVIKTEPVSSPIHPEPVTIKEEPKERTKPAFVVGERCLARWRDNRRFIATVSAVLDNSKYEIIFDDGVRWTCHVIRLSKLKEGANDPLTVDTSGLASACSTPSPVHAPGPSNAASAGAPAPTPNTALPFNTHLFDPTRDYLGSKSERREMKRKLNIKEIFNIGQKKKKVEPPPKKVEPPPKKVEPPPKRMAPKERVLTPKVVKPKVVKKKKEPDAKVKKEIPDAVASIIGTIPKDMLADVKAEVKDEPEEEKIVKNEAEDIKMDIDENNSETLSAPESQEMKQYDDSVLNEEVKLETFEKHEIKHEEVLDRMKLVINKLEDGIQKAENKVEQIEPKQEVKEEVETQKVDTQKVDTQKVEDKPVVSEVKKKNLSKIKKVKKVRLLQEKKVKLQVEKVKSELEEMKRQVEEMRKQMSEELARKQTELPESFLLPGEWCCRWVNGQPAGAVSELERENKRDANNKPVLPRRSVQVEDKRLPPGWTKHMVRRSFGNSAGKWDIVLMSPENRRFHTKTDMKQYLEHSTDETLKSYEHALMDFGIHLKLSRRMGWYTTTPDGEQEAPVMQLPIDSLTASSPLLKKRHLSLKKDKLKDTKRKKLRLKLKVPAAYRYDNYVTSADGCVPGTSGEVPCAGSIETHPENVPLEDGCVYVGSLKVQVIENLLRCPAEGCFKNFRNNTLLKMHIKHYHRELRKMLGATPKVLDLAYARTRPSEMEMRRLKLEAKRNKTFKVKIPRPPKRSLEPKPEIKDGDAKMEPLTTPIKEEQKLPKIPRSQDSPKLRNILSAKLIKRPKVLLPVRKPGPNETVVSGGEEIIEENIDIEDDVLMEPIVEVPAIAPLDFETAISTHTVTKPADVKRKGDKKKIFASISKASEDEEWYGMNSDVETRSSYPRSGTPDSKVEQKLVSSESNEDQKEANYLYTETGERIKIVHMKREEIINCHCGFREEDGLMVQCELCLCWQHALCHNIQREEEVPEKYTCSICLNPRRGRRSQRFLHDQDRLYEGLLAGARPCESLRRSHELSGNLHRIEDALHALRVKYYVATKKDHPKLYLWAKDWETSELSLTQEKLNSDYSDLSIMISNIGKENLPIKPEDIKDMQLDIKTPPSEEPDVDRFSQKDNQLGSQALLSGLLSSPGGASLDLPITTTELEKLAKTVQAEQEAQRVIIPQPEAAITNSACREHLLRHIQRCQALIDARLDSIEAQVAELESQDPSFEDDETADFFPRTKQTVQMLMRDLDTMEELGVIT